MQNATTGIGAFADNITLTNVTAQDNGLMGIIGNSAYGLTLDSVKAIHNNTERFNQSPAAGGLKIARSRNVTIKNSQFLDNLASGVWFDQ